MLLLSIDCSNMKGMVAIAEKNYDKTIFESDKLEDLA